MEIRADIDNLLSIPTIPAASADEELIEVSSATKRIAFAYERFRNTLEPDEEDILRRKAIFRILERRLAEDRPARVTATTILQELIRAHYIRPVGHAYIERVADLLEQARFIHERLSESLGSWFLRLVAVALDRELFPRDAEETLVYLMYTDTLKRTIWTDQLVKEADRATQLYMACHRALFAADDYEISYHYFKYQFPAWRTSTTHNQTELEAIARDLAAFHKELQRMIQHPARDRLTRILRPVAVPYRILRDVTQEQPDAFVSSEALAQSTREAITLRMRRIRERMAKRAWHSILFLFVTKTFIALILEVPYELLAAEGIHWLAIAINIAFHPLLLFVSATTARLPGERNTTMVVEQVQKIADGHSELGTVVVNEGRHYGAVTWSFFALIYAVLFMAIFWAMFAFLDKLHFSLVAMFMFVVFIGLVSFLAMRIRYAVTEVRIITPREGATSAVIGFLSLPILEFGRWLSQNISQVNIALFLMDRILEAPFKLLIDVTEEWFDFVRDRREEMM